MENNIEASSNMESPPSFLRNFVQEAEALAGETLSHPDTKKYFELPAGMKKAREGNASDHLRLKTQTMIYATKQLLQELRKGGLNTKEDFENEKLATKFVAFCEAQEPVSRLRAEANDDPSLAELAEMYKTYIERLAEDLK